MERFREYLRQRVQQVSFETAEEMSNFYNLSDDPTPKTAEDFVDRIVKGLYVLPYNDGDNYKVYGNGPYGILYRDPTRVADPKGFEAAGELLRTAQLEALDTIAVLPESDALAAFKNFQTYAKTLYAPVASPL